MVGDSSGSSGRSHSSSSRYDDLAARRFKAERDETRRELEAVSKKAGMVWLGRFPLTSDDDLLCCPLLW
jgi:hypothetical protein